MRLTTGWQSIRMFFSSLFRRNRINSGIDQFAWYPANQAEMLRSYLVSSKSWAISDVASGGVRIGYRKTNDLWVTARMQPGQSGWVTIITAQPSHYMPLPAGLDGCPGKGIPVPTLPGNRLAELPGPGRDDVFQDIERALFNQLAEVRSLTRNESMRERQLFMQQERKSKAANKQPGRFDLRMGQGETLLSHAPWILPLLLVFVLLGVGGCGGAGLGSTLVEGENMVRAASGKAAGGYLSKVLDADAHIDSCRLETGGDIDGSLSIRYKVKGCNINYRIGPCEPIGDCEQAEGSSVWTCDPMNNCEQAEDSSNEKQ